MSKVKLCNVVSQHCFPFCFCFRGSRGWNNHTRYDFFSLHTRLMSIAIDYQIIRFPNSFFFVSLIPADFCVYSRETSFIYTIFFYLTIIAIITIIITVIIKIIMKSKTRLVFSIVLVRMIFKITILHPIQSHHYQEAHQQSFYFEYLIVTEKEENPREARQAQAGRQQLTEKYIFTLTCFVWINNTTRKIFYITPKKAATFRVLFLLLLEKKKIFVSCTESWSVIVGSIYNNETTY